MKYSYCTVKRKGRKDGRNFKYTFWPFTNPKPVQPKTEATVCEFENQMLKAIEGIINDLANRWKELDSKLKPEYCATYSRKIGAEIAFNKESGEAKAEVNPFNDARKNYFSLPSPSLSKVWGILWLIFLGLAEFPLNSVAFQIFRVNRIETYIITASLCFALPYFSHHLGKALKQDHKSTTDIFLMIISPLAVLLLIGVLAIFREKLIEALGGQNLLNINLSSNTITTMFIIINLAIFMAGTLVSYESSHNNHVEYKTLKRTYKQALKRFNKESKEEQLAAKELDDAEEALNITRNRREKKHEAFVSKAKDIKLRYEAFAYAYRDSNLQARKDGSTPKSFINPPKDLIIPDYLDETKELDWNCDLKTPVQKGYKIDRKEEDINIKQEA